MEDRLLKKFSFKYNYMSHYIQLNQKIMGFVLIFKLPFENQSKLKFKLSTMMN
jgi:hypothetical protein